MSFRAMVLKRFTFIQSTKYTLLRGNFHENGMLEPYPQKLTIALLDVLFSREQLAKSSTNGSGKANYT
ncbi:hypothetical protein DPMN_058539 [Dreissena polymorpha]|uniref:Uncharacterized protein n=1 Tax=Dreissena polymorpha TaxID=45954 RepID=A0A9D4C1X9_DREPO|nr:hypothetical protein DPMN_058539 [Dreissena polymorpha]